jgi:hypothetical protein
MVVTALMEILIQLHKSWYVIVCTKVKTKALSQTIFCSEIDPLILSYESLYVCIRNGWLQLKSLRVSRSQFLTKHQLKRLHGPLKKLLIV